MSRSRKLILVGLVLATGFALAWPFRKTEEPKTYDSVAKSGLVPLDQANRSAMEDTPTLQAPQLGAPAPHVVAKVTSMAEAQKSTALSQPRASFDLANHPALVSTPLREESSPVTPAVPPAAELQSPVTSVQHPPPKNTFGDARPAYQTADSDHAFEAADQQPEEVRHVVQNSDTLEKLAKRYLGDEGRALEIFDLNRDILDNPHLLPINAELRIPADARVTLE